MIIASPGQGEAGTSPKFPGNNRKQDDWRIWKMRSRYNFSSLDPHDLHFSLNVLNKDYMTMFLLLKI